MAGVEVSVTVCGKTVTVNSDADGFVIAKVPVGDIEPGWHEVQFLRWTAAVRSQRRDES